MINATLQGRNLAIHMDGIEEDFIIPPLNGRKGQDLTNRFINIAAGKLSPEGTDQMMRDAVGDAAYERVQDELSLSEGESILLPALYWQTVLGLDGVNAYISGGEGIAGAKKALELLIWTLGISPTQTAPSGALESLIQKPGLTPPTGVSTTTAEKLPVSKRSRNQNQKPASPQ